MKGDGDTIRSLKDPQVNVRRGKFQITTHLSHSYGWTNDHFSFHNFFSNTWILLRGHYFGLPLFLPILHHCLCHSATVFDLPLFASFPFILLFYIWFERKKKPEKYLLCLLKSILFLSNDFWIPYFLTT